MSSKNEQNTGCYPSWDTETDSDKDKSDDVNSKLLHFPLFGSDRGKIVWDLPYLEWGDQEPPEVAGFLVGVEVVTTILVVNLWIQGIAKMENKTLFEWSLLCFLIISLSLGIVFAAYSNRIPYGG